MTPQPTPSAGDIARALGGKRAGKGWLAHCPAHDDQHPSLSITDGPGGKVLLKCMAGCAQEAVIAALRDRKLWPEPAKSKTPPSPGAIYTYRDADGKVLFQVVRKSGKRFFQRRPDGRGRWIHNLNGVTRVLYRLPEVLAAVKAGQRVWISEGERDADNVAMLNLVATTNPGGAGKWRPEYADALRGAHVVVLPDKDEPGRKHAEQVARSLYGVAASLKVLELPGEGKDVSDWLEAGGTREELERLADEAPEWTPPAIPPRPEALLQGAPAHAGDKPAIVVNNRFLREIAADALAALRQANDPPFLFRRGGAWVRVPEGASRAEALTPAALKGVLDRVADFLVLGERDSRPARPPADLAPDLLALPDPGLPELRAISTVPVFLPDGRLLATDGYDPSSGLLLRLRGLGPVKYDMSVEEALGWLFGELLTDFPFVDEAGRAHSLAAMVERFVRPMIDGPTPLYLIDAPAQGTGKGLFADVIAVVATGKPARVMALPPSEEETEKRITTVLLEAPPMVLLDNVTALRSTSLAAALTATLWCGRKLGETRLLELPNTATWLATGNNVELSHELARRTVPIRLDAGMERPEERTGFRHENLAAWAREHRTELVSACLSLVQHWLDAGRPPGDRTLGRFESWARIMGGILEVAGVPGFLEGRDKLYATADRETQDWAAACAAWWDTYGPQPVTAGDLLPVLKDRELLMDLWAARSHTAALQRLGHALGRNRDRVFGRWVVRLAGRDARTRNQSYRLELREREGSQKTPETPETREKPASDGLPARVFWNETPAADPKTPAAAPDPKTPAAEAKHPQNTRDENALQERLLGREEGVLGVSGVLFPASPPRSNEDEEWEVFEL